MYRLAVACLTTFACVAQSAPVSDDDPSLGAMRGRIERYSTDGAALRRYYSIDVSTTRVERLRRFYEEQLRKLEAVDFKALDQDGRIDYLLFQNQLRFELRELDHEQKRVSEVAGLLPFSQGIIQLEEARRRMEPVDSAKSAKALTEIAESISKTRKELEKQLKDDKKGSNSTLPGKVTANRAAGMADELRRTLKNWNEFYSGYHPDFTWWASAPHQRRRRSFRTMRSFSVRSSRASRRARTTR